MKAYLHSLPTGTEFTYKKKKYRTICPIRYTVVSACRARMNRTVMDLQKHLAVKLNYFIEVFHT